MTKAGNGWARPQTWSRSGQILDSARPPTQNFLRPICRSTSEYTTNSSIRVGCRSDLGLTLGFLQQFARGRRQRDRRTFVVVVADHDGLTVGDQLTADRVRDLVDQRETRAADRADADPHL